MQNREKWRNLIDKATEDHGQVRSSRGNTSSLTENEKIILK